MPKYFLSFFLFFYFFPSIRAQYIYYTKPITEQIAVDNPFYIIGDIDNHTLIYIRNVQKQQHTVLFYDVKMHYKKEYVLESIPSSHTVIGFFKLKTNDYIVFHSVNDVSKTTQFCFATTIYKDTTKESQTSLVKSISYDGKDNIFEIVKSPSENYCMVYLIGTKDETTAALINFLYNDAGIKTEKKISFFPFQALSGEQFSGHILNDRGDFFFYLSTKNRFAQLLNAKIFMQNLNSEILNMRYINFQEDKLNVYKLKPFFQSTNNTWNIYALYYPKGKSRYAEGWVIKSWMNNNLNKMVLDNKYSFGDYLSALTRKVDPYLLEDMEINKEKINNKLFLKLIEPKEEVETDDNNNYEEEGEDEEIEFLEEEEEVTTKRFQNLMELFSLSNIEIIEVIEKTNGDFLVLMENKTGSPGGENFSKKTSNFLSSINPSLSIGFGTSIGTIGSGAYIGSSVPLYSGSKNDKSKTINANRLNNLIVINYDKEGIFKWGTSLNKRQTSRVGEQLSFCQIKQNNNVQLFYTNQGAPSYIYSISLRPNGQVKIAPTVKGVSAAYATIPLQAKQTSSNSIVIPCIYKNTLAFSRLTYE